MKAKKSLGQNFLKSEIALRKIVEAGEIKKNDVILEIGPGKGALTEKLLENVYPDGAGRGIVIAVEKDRELFIFLKEKFAPEIKSGALVLLNEDILEFNVSETFPSFSKTFHYKIIANIPYNITGAILKKFLTEKKQPECMVLMVQHEVAKRIVARDNKESILSISVKAYGEPKMIMKVAARYFSPAPKVDSAIIKISNISRKLFTNSPLEEYPLGGGGISTPSRKRATPQEGNFETRFWEIVKTGFAHKRKKLSSNLKNILKYTGNACVLELGNKRAEDLSLSDWINLAK
ncbi:MAG: 16S rRNA (adenine(1518)-N(6)/adenine(1519)-N(6))-dimethyltransferase RsmA [Candidatus Paceibacterota bacterium]|jgi:16S rRNA (adenine1518-N6/adenine1519-N6)-dimethyltransferase